ncbi:MAG: protein tyrosine phosphatase [Oscillospiraceae bacterium]|nr:protein tyrosine phosphatase [Oscillospiraceae bacterium]
MKLLFLCSQNKRRSLTAEKIFGGLDGHIARSAGTENNSRIKVTAGLLGWADIIFCMEKKHVRRIKEKYNDVISGKEVVCLNIPDDYGYMDETLIGILEASVGTYIGIPN